MNEWTFTADIASQINQIVAEHAYLPFSKALVEERGRGNRKRRDLTIYDRDGNVIVTGEIKMPDSPDGRSPYQDSLVIDAHQKANSIGVEYYFTWNVNKCVLWKTFEQGKSITERYLEPFDVLPAPILSSDQLLHPRVRDQISQFLLRFLERCAAIISGAQPMPLLPLDVKFIEVWEAALLPLIADTLQAINHTYETDRRFKNQLNKWMRDEQGWILSNDEEILRDNLQRAARFTCYVLANKIIFYKALRRRFTRMKVLKISSSVLTGEDLRQTLSSFFEAAKLASNDYQTVFDGDFGDTLPYLSDKSVAGWRDLSNQTDAFDFTQINYEVMGQIFEKLLSTTERHKFGQHYTRSEVVDLINSFCIRDASATILDPACGGGTFPVRAYQRKSDLSNQQLDHRELINSIYALDISAYPVHLTTINLATRDLIEEANYPLVARQDFLRTKLYEPIFHVPLGTVGRAEQITWLQLPRVDVVIGNPPYVRSEKINEYYGRNYKRMLGDGARVDAPEVHLSGRSDILCYFFTHAGTFLNDGGYMGFLTSSGWLDTTYGFVLQKYLLSNYEIIAILESAVEPWFTGARVTTAATILRKQTDAELRLKNLTKFVWLKVPISEFLRYDTADDDARLTFDDFRDYLLQLKHDEDTARWRVRVRSQEELYRAGCLPISIEPDEDDESDEIHNEEDGQPEYVENHSLPGVAHVKERSDESEYIGSKWGAFLRAPRIFFKLLTDYGSNFVLLGSLGDVKRGVVSGCDMFYFPRDVTDEAMEDVADEGDFRDRFGINRTETNSVRILKAGDGTYHPIEASFLEPEIHSMFDINSVSIDREGLQRRAVLISQDKTALAGTHALNYIRWGEREHFHERRTVAARIREDRNWYDLTDAIRREIILPKIQQYRHIVSLNPDRLICSSSLLTVQVDQSLVEITCGILNSTIVALYKQFFARIHGREGSLQLDVYAAEMMSIPDPRLASAQTKSRILSALESMKNRDALPLVEVDAHGTDWTGELALDDRQVLDDAVLELLGVQSERKRQNLRTEVYAEITTLYRQIRSAELIMRRYRTETARHGRATVQSIADEIWNSPEGRFDYRMPSDFVSRRVPIELIDLPFGPARIIKGNMIQPDGLRVAGTIIDLGDPRRAIYLKKFSALGIAGQISVPVSGEICQEALETFEVYHEETTDRLTKLAAAFTADEQWQERIVRLLMRKAKLKREGGEP